MTKIIEIECCINCPYCETDDEESYCNKVDYPRGIIKNLSKMTSWCPLPDKESKK
jgi:hypothetical protein